MINHISSLLSVNKTSADFTFWVCGMVPLHPQYPNGRYLTDLQQLLQYHKFMASSENWSNQPVTIPYTDFMRLKSRAGFH